MRFIGIDPSTKTGIVVLDDLGEVITALEIKGVGDIDPHRMRTMIDTVIDLVELGDFVCIEGLAFGATGNFVLQMGGIAWGYRMMLDFHDIGYTEITPNAVKKFAGAKSHYGEKGHMKRFKGTEIKKEMKRAVIDSFGYTHKSDNVIDAYVIARIGYEMNTGNHALLCTPEQCEVINLLKGV